MVKCWSIIVAIWSFKVLNNKASVEICSTPSLPDLNSPKNSPSTSASLYEWSPNNLQEKKRTHWHAPTPPWAPSCIETHSLWGTQRFHTEPWTEKVRGITSFRKQIPHLGNWGSDRSRGIYPGGMTWEGSRHAAPKHQWGYYVGKGCNFSWLHCTDLDGSSWETDLTHIRKKFLIMRGI